MSPRCRREETDLAGRLRGVCCLVRRTCPRDVSQDVSQGRVTWTCHRDVSRGRVPDSLPEPVAPQVCYLLSEEVQGVLGLGGEGRGHLWQLLLLHMPPPRPTRICRRRLLAETVGWISAIGSTSTPTATWRRTWRTCGARRRATSSSTRTPPLPSPSRLSVRSRAHPAREGVPRAFPLRSLP